jgi:hypothetical protein
MTSSSASHTSRCAKCVRSFIASAPANRWNYVSRSGSRQKRFFGCGNKRCPIRRADTRFTLFTTPILYRERAVRGSSAQALLVTGWAIRCPTVRRDGATRLTRCVGGKSLVSLWNHELFNMLVDVSVRKGGPTCRDAHLKNSVPLPRSKTVCLFRDTVVLIYHLNVPPMLAGALRTSPLYAAVNIRY